MPSSSALIGVFLIVGLTAVAALLAPTAAAIGYGPVWIDVDGDGAFTPGEWNGTSIQAAIDNATTGQTIYVGDGTYYKNVLVNKSVTLKNASQPVVDALGGTGFNITVENVTIEGFNITNCSYGINSTALAFDIRNNTITASVEGIHLYLHDIGCNLSGTESYAIGNSPIYKNVINATSNGIYLDAENWSHNLSENAVVNLGAFRIEENTIDCQDGINITMQYFGSYLAGYANFTWDGLIITGNTITYPLPLSLSFIFDTLSIIYLK